MLIFKCPCCLKKLGDRDSLCKSCGFCLSQIDEQIGSSIIELHRIVDVTNSLNTSETNIVKDKILLLESQFPQIAFSVIFANLKEFSNLRELGFWILNHGRFIRDDMIVTGSYGVLILLDLTGKNLGLSVGYFLEKYLSHEELKNVLNNSRDLFSVNNNKDGILKILSDLREVLIKKIVSERNEIELKLKKIV